MGKDDRPHWKTFKTGGEALKDRQLYIKMVNSVVIRLDAWTKIQGTPTPFGASWVDSAKAWNFALYSTEATAVRLLIYGKNDLVNPIRSYDLDPRLNKTIRVWHILVAASDVSGATYYAFKVGGPHNPSAGQLFDSAKVLLDPYARGIFLPPDFSRTAAISPGPNEAKAPLGILPAQSPAESASDNRPMPHTTSSSTNSTCATLPTIPAPASTTPRAVRTRV